MSSIMEEVERFIRRYYDLELILSNEAHKIEMKSGRNFADCLSDGVTEYIDSIEKEAYVREQKAKALIYWINKSYSCGFVQPGTNLLGKLEECRKRNTELMKDLAICMANYATLQKEHERLVKMLDQNQSEDWKKKEEEQ